MKTWTSKIRRTPTAEQRKAHENAARAYIVDPATGPWVGVPDGEPEWSCRKCAEPSGYSFLCGDCWRSSRRKGPRGVECEQCGRDDQHANICTLCQADTSIEDLADRFVEFLMWAPDDPNWRQIGAYAVEKIAEEYGVLEHLREAADHAMSSPRASAKVRAEWLEGVAAEIENIRSFRR